jgi:murein DD-endopeptidase MepM/ murein hydrolase activator NlpD
MLINMVMIPARPRPRSVIGILLLATAVLLVACGGRTPTALPGSTPPDPEPTPAIPTPFDNGPDDPDAPIQPLATAQQPPSQPPVVEPPPLPTPNDTPAEPTPTLDALIFVQPQTVLQGQTFLVAVDAPTASAASVAVNGEFFSLTPEADRFFTILPVAADAPPGSLPLTIAVADADGRIALQIDTTITILDAAYATELVELDPTLTRLLDPDVIAEDRNVRETVQRQKSPERLWSRYFLQPSGGGISSTFGVRRSFNGAEATDFHTGMDHAGALGLPITAPETGIVAWTGETERRGLGVIIDHGAGVFTNYWHLSSIDITVEAGTSILRGDAIGRMGNSGLSTGPHLHWEVVVHGVPVDPLQWIRENDVPNPAAIFDPAQAINAATPTSGAATTPAN